MRVYHYVRGNRLSAVQHSELAAIGPPVLFAPKKLRLDALRPSIFAGVGVALGSTSRSAVLCIGLAALCAVSLQANNLVITLDPAETKVAFTLGATFHSVHGTFRLQSGHITFDPSTHALSGEIIVSAASGESGNATRDRRMRQEVLQVRRYPEVRFSPTACSGPVAMNGVSRVDVTGLLLIHGAEHRITLPMQIQLSRDDITAAGTFIVPYVRWGMKNPSLLFLKVSKDVKIDVTAVGHVRQVNAK